MKLRRAVLRTAAVSILALCAENAHAQQAGSQEAAQATPPSADGGLEDIVVTAERRSGSVQSTPLAITAVGGEDIRSREIASIVDLAPSLPGVSFGRNQGYARIAIRGVGYDSTLAAQEARVAYHLDGVYISRPAATLATFFDVDRIEVVRGPQGTLYGRNATGGALNVISNSPKFQMGGYSKLTVGNYDTVNFEAAVTGPVSDTVAARFAVNTVNRAGYGTNLLTGESVDNEHVLAGRASLLFKPGELFSYTVAADYSYEDDANHFTHFLGAGNPGATPVAILQGARTPADPRDVYADFTPDNKRRYYGFTGTGNLEVGGVTLTSITAHRYSSTRTRLDGDGSEKLLSIGGNFELARQFSQELRASGDVGPLKYVIGGYYFDEKIDGARTFSPLKSPVPTIPLSQGLDFNGRLTTSAYALFGQFDWRIVEPLTLTVGGRYSHEKKGIDQRGANQITVPYNPNAGFAYTLFQRETNDYGSFTPKATLTFKPSDEFMAYATYAVGFKSGGYNLSAFVAPLKPEKLKDYEVGVKADFFDRRVRVNAAAFVYDYTNLQVQIIQGVSAIPLNAASAKVKGAEVELFAKPVENLVLEANGSFIDSKYKDFATADSARPTLGVLDLSGNRLTQAPAYTINLAAQYTIPLSSGDLDLRGEVRWVDRVYFTPFNTENLSQAANSKLNAFVTYADQSGWTLSTFVRNLTDRRTVSAATISNSFLGFPILGSFEPPRTYGASIGLKF